MSTMYCALCKRPVEARRQVGIGTIFLAVITAGVTLLAIPFYPKRCSICKSSAVTHVPLTGYLDAGESRSRALDQREAELDDVAAELDRLRTERDFYRQLLGDRAPEADRQRKARE